MSGGKEPRPAGSPAPLRPENAATAPRERGAGQGASAGAASPPTARPAPGQRPAATPPARSAPLPPARDPAASADKTSPAADAQAPTTPAAPPAPPADAASVPSALVTEPVSDAGGAADAVTRDGDDLANETFDQASIDALFGIESAPRPARRTGLRALIEADVAHHERLPMLEIVCERMVRTFGTSMRNLTSDSLDVHTEQVRTSRFADFMNHLPLPAMIGVFRAKQWGNYGLMTVDSSLVYAVVDSLLGGRRVTQQLRIDGRAFTAIETHLVGRMIQQTLDDFAYSFAAIEPVDFQLERVEVTPRFAAIAAPTNLTAVASFRIDMEGRGGRFNLVLPFATLEPVREKLLQRFVGEKLGRDTMWEAHMADQLLRTEVQVEAVLGEKEMRVDEYLALAAGRTISLDRAPDSDVVLECGGVPLAAGRIGTHSALAAVQLSTAVREVAR